MKRSVARCARWCCLTSMVGALATPGLLPAQTRGPERADRTAGFGFDYGLYLSSGFGLYRSTFTGRPEARTVLRAATSLSGRILVDLESILGELSPAASTSLHARLSSVGAPAFYGWGNATGASRANGYYRLERTQLTVEPALTLATVDGAARFAVGPVFKYTTSESPAFDAASSAPDATAGILLDAPVYGAGRFLQAGLRAEFSARRHRGGRAGIEVTAGASAYPALMSVTRPFGEAHATVAGVATAPLPAEPTLELRLGGRKAFGAPPMHEAAFLGGGGTLRGYAPYRFAGDAAVYGGAELRLTIGRAYLLRWNGRFGVVGLADAGRVCSKGGSPGGWHTALGGGLWFAPFGSATTFSLTAARGAEGTRVYFRTGVGY